MLALLIGLTFGWPGARAHGDPVASGACPAPPGAGHGAVGPLFDRLGLDRLERLRAQFSEEKHVALLVRPLRSTGTIYFDRTRGLARVTRTPRPERVVLTATVLRIEKADRVEEIPLERSKALGAFALVFPALLRGERERLEAAFDLAVAGPDGEAWTLTLVPRDPALCGLVSRVVVSGHGPELEALQVVEASGDATETRFSGIARNGAVPASEIAQGFGEP